MGCTLIALLSQREKAVSSGLSYPFITQLRFLRLSLAHHPAYPHILNLLKPYEHHHKILDVGTALGQDVRKLLHDGVSAASIVGLELDPRFNDLGYDLFLDRSRLEAQGPQWLFGDVLVISQSDPSLLNTFSIINTSSLLHLFPLEKQHALCRAFVSLLRPEPGSTVIGWSIGSPTPMDYFDFTNFGLQYRHSVESFREMWESVGRETRTEWKVEGSLREGGGEGGQGEEAYWVLEFEVVRI